MSEESESIESRVKKLEEQILFLNEVKCNARPFQWLNHRVGQVERRLDKLKLDNWEGDLGLDLDNYEGAIYLDKYEEDLPTS